LVGEGDLEGIVWGTGCDW